MHIEPLAVDMRERQGGQKLPLGGAEFPARPLDDYLGLEVELFARIADGAVVIAEDGDSALLDQIHDGRHRPIGIGAVADIVAEQHDALRALFACLRETGAERLPVGVNIRE